MLRLAYAPEGGNNKPANTIVINIAKLEVD